MTGYSYPTWYPVWSPLCFYCLLTSDLWLWPVSRQWYLWFCSVFHRHLIMSLVWCPSSFFFVMFLKSVLYSVRTTSVFQLLCTSRVNTNEQCCWPLSCHQNSSDVLRHGLCKTSEGFNSTSFKSSKLQSWAVINLTFFQHNHQNPAASDLHICTFLLYPTCWLLEWCKYI